MGRGNTTLGGNIMVMLIVGHPTLVSIIMASLYYIWPFASALKITVTQRSAVINTWEQRQTKQNWDTIG